MSYPFPSGGYDADDEYADYALPPPTARSKTGAHIPNYVNMPRRFKIVEAQSSNRPPASRSGPMTIPIQYVNARSSPDSTRRGPTSIPVQIISPRQNYETECYPRPAPARTSHAKGGALVRHPHHGALHPQRSSQRPSPEGLLMVSPASPTRPEPGSPTTPKSPSSRDNLARPYQLQATMDGGSRMTALKAAPFAPKSAALKRGDEVDELTSLLMQNIQASSDPEFYGMCAKCGRAIMGENSGCRALDQLFHVSCFLCVECGCGLKGFPFFAMDGQAYCEQCYYNTLVKCDVCGHPITARMLRATGKAYHPGCFACVVCGKLLDGVPFTVDSASQIHCIEDFHKKFAPRCSVCIQPIVPESGQQETVRIVALDRSFHTHCYKCEDCGMLLSSESEGRGCYPLDDRILCKSCNARRIQKLTTNVTTEL